MRSAPSIRRPNQSRRPRYRPQLLRLEERLPLGDAFLGLLVGASLLGPRPVPLAAVAASARQPDVFSVERNAHPSGWLDGWAFRPTEALADAPRDTQAAPAGDLLHDVYPGIDLVWYGSQRQLEYDCVVAPGADPSAIRLGFTGAERLEVDSTGDLVVSAGGQELRQQRPVVYQEVGAARRDVADAFVVDGAQVGFRLGAYDATRPLVIDPVLSYATYLGGSARDAGESIAVGGDGSAYVTGSTASPDFPIANPIQPNLAGVVGEGVFFRSTNGAASWQSRSKGLPPVDVGALAVDPANPGVIYAGTSGSGVFASNGGGGKWVSRSAGLTNLQIRVVAIDPVQPAQQRTLYAGTAGGGVFKSIDRGASWAPANSGLTSLDIRALAISPTQPATLYAAAGGGLFKSTNRGQTWAAVSLPGTPGTVLALALHPTAPATLYVGTSGQFGRLFRSTDGGATWTQLNVPPVPPPPFRLTAVTGLDLDPVTPTVLYARVAVTVCVLPLGCTTSLVLYRTANDGASWSSRFSQQGGIGPVLSALVIDPQTPSTLYLGSAHPSRGGVYKSIDGGASWSHVGLDRVNALALDPAAPSTVYAATNYINPGVGPDSFVAKISP